MSKAVRKRWVWDLYPLQRRTWGNQEIDNDGTPPGQTIDVKRSHGRGLVTYLDTGESHPYGTRTINRPAYIPTEDDLALLRRCYPKDDPQRPAWYGIKADLVIAGHAPDALDKSEATVLLALLAKAKAAKGEGGKLKDDAMQAKAETPALTASVKKTAARRGRKKLSAKETQRRQGILERWEQASEAGVTRERFCDDKEITPRELQNYQDWARQRQNRQQ